MITIFLNEFIPKNQHVVKFIHSEILKIKHEFENNS